MDKSEQSDNTPRSVLYLFVAGHVPGRPQGGRHGMVFGQIPVSGTSSATASSVQVPLVPGRVFVPSIFLCILCL